MSDHRALRHVSPRTGYAALCLAVLAVLALLVGAFWFGLAGLRFGHSRAQAPENGGTRTRDTGPPPVQQPQGPTGGDTRPA